MSQTVYFLKGLPGSSKTTWSKQKLHEDHVRGIRTKRVNKDDLRAMLDSSVWSQANESFVLRVRDEIIWLALLDGSDVIVDDTNFAPKHRNNIQRLIKVFNDTIADDKVEFVEKFFDVPLEECIYRDSQRESPVGEAVIRGMYNKYLKEEKDGE
jgi:tRNA uridine 5-carbamoylmethylation protein Kti12